MKFNCLTATAWALLACALGVAPAGAQNGYQILSNQHFATVTDGPMGLLVVDEDAGETVHRRVGRAVTRPTAPAWFSLLVKRGLLPPNQPWPVVPQTIVHRSMGRLVTPELSGRQADTLGNPNNHLTYSYTPVGGDTEAKAWSATQQKAISDYLASAETELRRVYGAPAFANTVRVVHDPGLNSLQMGVYDASKNEIRLELLNDAKTADATTTAVDDYDFYVLTMLVLQAYRDDAAIGFDSWETGMARAAQALVINNVRPTFGFLARDFNLLFGHYDSLNQPGLESPSFFGAESGSDAETMRSALGTVRAYMCQAAWLKVLAERPTLFADFNAQYYNALKTAQSYRFSVPLLRGLMTGLAPQVEGLGFADWYTRQYCLDTAVIPGAKLYIFCTPQKDFIGGQPTNSFPMSVYHFETTTTNQQLPLTGTVKFTYLAYDDFDLTPAVEGASGVGGIKTDIGQAGNAAGIGSAVPLFFNIAGDQGVQQQRIQVTAIVNGVQRQLYFANDVAADDSQIRNDVYGLVTNGFQGSVKVEIEGRDAVTAAVIQGAFKCRIPGGLPTPAKATLTWTPDSSGGSTGDAIRRNLMFLGLLGSGSDVANGEASLTLDTPPETLTTFNKAIPAGLSMITIPAWAKRHNAAEVLGVPANQLVLARADGAIATFQPWRLGELYRVWPSTPPFQPGYGFWVKAATALTLNFQGVAASRDAPFRQFYPPGWQQIGNPFADLTIKLKDLKLQAPDGTDAVTLAGAQTAGLISSGVFRYASGSYQLVSSDAPLAAYEGYWLNVVSSKGVTVIYPNAASAARTGGATSAATPAGSATRQVSARASQEANSWLVRLEARGDGLTDTVAGFGVTPGAGDGYTSRDVPQPPPFGSYLTVGFPHGDWGRSAGRYVRDLRDVVARETTWDVLVESDKAGRQVTLSWPDVATVPGDVSLVLTDLDSGQQKFMRTTAAYTTTVGQNGKRLRVTASRGLSGRLTILSLDAHPGRAQRAGTLNFNLSAPAQVTAQLLSPTGHLLSVIGTGRAASRGANALDFTAVDSAGRPLPNGIYRLDLIAVGEDGQQARATRTVVVKR